MERCCKYIPGLATAPVVREAVELRPGRKTVRVEVDDTITKRSTVILIVDKELLSSEGVYILDAVKLVEECLLRRGFINNHNQL